MAWSDATRQKRAALKAKWAAAPTIRCSCGAEWRGRYALDNRVIDAHRQRATCHVTEKPNAPQRGEGP